MVVQKCESSKTAGRWIVTYTRIRGRHSSHSEAEIRNFWVNTCAAYQIGRKVPA